MLVCYTVSSIADLFSNVHDCCNGVLIKAVLDFCFLRVNLDTNDVDSANLSNSWLPTFKHAAAYFILAAAYFKHAAAMAGDPSRPP